MWSADAKLKPSEVQLTQIHTQTQTHIHKYIHVHLYLRKDHFNWNYTWTAKYNNRQSMLDFAVQRGSAA